MRQKWRIVGFSSIPTVLDFPANFRARDASDFGPKTVGFGRKIADSGRKSDA
jgi:hypothetical protein